MEAKESRFRILSLEEALLPESRICFLAGRAPCKHSEVPKAIWHGGLPRVGGPQAAHTPTVQCLEGTPHGGTAMGKEGFGSCWCGFSSSE